MVKVVTSVAALLLALSAPQLASAIGGGKATGTSVKVTITDSKLGVSPSGLQSGATRFVVVNNGRKSHVFAISGPGLGAGRTAKIAPGASAELTVRLRTGAYMVTLTDNSALGRTSTHWLQVIPAIVVSAKGGSSIVQNPPDPITPVCGGLMP